MNDWRAPVTSKMWISPDGQQFPCVGMEHWLAASYLMNQHYPDYEWDEEFIFSDGEIELYLYDSALLFEGWVRVNNYNCVQIGSTVGIAAAIVYLRSLPEDCHVYLDHFTGNYHDVPEECVAELLKLEAEYA